MCSVACKNYCQFHLSLYGSSNSVLFVLNSLEMHVIYIYVCMYVCMFLCGVCQPVGGRGRYRRGIREVKEKTR
jgi:hypothetical protein